MYPVTYFNVTEQVSFSRPSDATAYSVGDIITSTSPAALVFPFTGRRQGGYLTRATLTTDRSTQTEALRLHLLSSLLTPPADNAALNFTYAQLRDIYVGYVDFTTYVAAGTSGLAFSEGQMISRPMQFPETSNILFGYLEVRGAFTPMNSQQFGLNLYAEYSA